MGQIKTRSFKCPYCGQGINIAVSDSINIDAQKEYKERMLKGNYFNCSCLSCNEVFKAEYPLLIENPSNNALIYFVPPRERFKLDKVENMPAVNSFGKKLRIVNTQKELVEKIIEFDDHLEDIIIEYIKTVIFDGLERSQKNKVKDFFYIGMDEEVLKFVAPTRDGTYNINVPKKIYTNYNQKFNIKESYKFVKIDKTNINNYIF